MEGNDELLFICQVLFLWQQKYISIKLKVELKHSGENRESRFGYVYRDETRRREIA